MLIVDSREKKNQHILQQFNVLGIDYKIHKMDVADYQIEDKNQIVVDRKQNLDELAHNLMTNDKGRFYREIRLAHRRKIKMVVVCEHGQNVKNLQDVADWKSKHSTATGRRLMDSIFKVQMAYGVDFIFCDKSQTANLILQILGGHR